MILSLSVSTRIPGGTGGTRKRENGTGTARNQTYRVEGGAEGDSGGGGGGARGGGERNTRDRQHSFVFSSARFGSTSYRIPRVFLRRIVGQISLSIGSLPLPLSLSRLRPARFRRPAEKGRVPRTPGVKNRAETRGDRPFIRESPYPFAYRSAFLTRGKYPEWCVVRNVHGGE